MHSYASVYVQDTEKAKRATVKRSSNSQQLNQTISFDLTAVSAHKNPYAQTFQILREWAQRYIQGDDKKVIYAANRPATAHLRRYDALKSSEVAERIV